MTTQKRQELSDLIEIINQLDEQSITLLKSGADMLRARERMDQLPNGQPPDSRRAS